ncbi:uncharacterized protein M6B38_208185 [Iris pallida]|uniref:Uncharacterized protein n=1 Tax=Iris pallida TaxID=29817 RepID=A0AAX6E5B8_IRIPA|nr:uncharacterized protein M6B38_208185 [Iris pallida]
MDGSTSAISVSEGNNCQLCVNCHDSEKSYVENKQCSLGDKKKAAIFKYEAVDVSKVGDDDVDAVPVIGVDADGSFHISKSCEQISLRNSSCEQNDADICNEINLCEGFCQSLSVVSKVPRNFSKSASFPSSRDTCSVPPIVSAQDKSSTSETSAYARSVSLPASLKLVPAMKGGRAQSGTSPKVELHVKWAPEVYDPPCSIVSHTVNSHRQRPKSKKKDNRKSKNKGKPARGSGGGDRKNTNHKYVTKVQVPTDTGLDANGHEVLLNGYGKPEILGYAVGSQEAKCASSFLREVFPKLHLPVGEAS